MSNTDLHIFNTRYDLNISLSSAKGLPSITIQPRQTATADLSRYQKDTQFLENLYTHTVKGSLVVTYQKATVTPDQLKRIQEVGLVALSTSKSFEIEFQNLTDGPGAFNGHESHFISVNKSGTQLEYVSIEQVFLQIPLRSYSTLLGSLKRDMMPTKDRVNELSKKVSDQKQEIHLLMRRNSVLNYGVIIGWVVATAAFALAVWSILK